MNHATTTQTLPPTVTLEKVQRLDESLAAREDLLRQLIEGFEQKHRGTLAEFSQQLRERKLTEYPAWEESIEWGNTTDQLAQVRLMRSIVLWLTSLLKPSASS